MGAHWSTKQQHPSLDAIELNTTRLSLCTLAPPAAAEVAAPHYACRAPRHQLGCVTRCHSGVGHHWLSMSERGARLGGGSISLYRA